MSLKSYHITFYTKVGRGEEKDGVVGRRGGYEPRKREFHGTGGLKEDLMNIVKKRE